MTDFLPIPALGTLVLPFDKQSSLISSFQLQRGAKIHRPQSAIVNRPSSKREPQQPKLNLLVGIPTIESSQQTRVSPSEMRRATGRRALTTSSPLIVFLLHLVFSVTDVVSFSAPVPSPGAVLTTPSRDLSKSILEGLRSSHPNLTAKLDLETDFYDASTGLCSEGVWHNCLAGIASL
jgi:hypothetical protein